MTAAAPGPIIPAPTARASHVARILDYAAAMPRACSTHTDPIITRDIATPLGSMVGAACRDGLCLLEFGDRPALEREVHDLSRLLGRPFVADDGSGPSALRPGIEHLDLAQRELDAYFEGDLARPTRTSANFDASRADFSVSLCLPGTPFERRVWAALQQIAFGQTTSYGRLAFKLGHPGGARAIGRANGRNRVAIIVPCHRVVNEDGSLNGYGGGVHRKERLLHLERDAVAQSLLFAPPPLSPAPPLLSAPPAAMGEVGSALR